MRNFRMRNFRISEIFPKYSIRIYQILVSSFSREFKLYSRRSGEWLQPLIFFIIILGIFSITLGNYPEKIKENLPGILWVGVVLSLILSQESVFYTDKESGLLDILLLLPTMPTIVILAKILTHTIVVGLPLLFASLLSGLMFELPLQTLWGLFFSLSIGIPSISLICAIASTLTLSLKRGGVLLAILVLPLLAPIVLFGISATTAAMEKLPITSHLSIMAALLLLLLGLAPLTCLFGLRISTQG
jgi:heme exporter protein B